MDEMNSWPGMNVSCGFNGPYLGTAIDSIGCWDGCFWFPFERWDRSVAYSPSPNWKETYYLCTTYSPCLLRG